MPAAVRLFLCGDVMTGRGIDQILPHPCEPRALRAVPAERARLRASSPSAPAARFHARWTSPISGATRSASSSARAPDARIINLETAVTTSEDALAGEGHQLPHASGERRLASPPRASTAACSPTITCSTGERAGLDETLATLHARGNPHRRRRPPRAAEAPRRRSWTATGVRSRARVRVRHGQQRRAAVLGGDHLAGPGSPAARICRRPALAARGACIDAAQACRRHRRRVACTGAPNWGYERVAARSSASRRA